MEYIGNVLSLKWTSKDVMTRVRRK